MTDGSGKNRRIVATVVCRAGNLTDALAESLRVEVHKQLDEVCRWGERAPYRVVER